MLDQVNIVNIWVWLKIRELRRTAEDQVFGSIYLLVPQMVSAFWLNAGLAEARFLSRKLSHADVMSLDQNRRRDGGGTQTTLGLPALP